MIHPLHVAAVTTSSTPTLIMDFSNFNAAEQAHMTKVIEKRQVSTPSHPILYSQLIFQINRCKTSSKCIPISSKNASTLAAMTSQARLCHQKRSFFHLVSFDAMFIFFYFFRSNASSTAQKSSLNIRRESGLGLQNKMQVCISSLYDSAHLKLPSQRR